MPHPTSFQYSVPDQPLGATIGSVQLDNAFENAVQARLEMANRTINLGLQEKELDGIAWEMAKSKEYQNAKCEYGSSDDDTEFFTVAVPKIHRGYSNGNAGISNGEMRFRRSVSSLSITCITDRSNLNAEMKSKAILTYRYRFRTTYEKCSNVIRL